ncbi:DUF4878 domain-containing protein [Mycolicibacterium fortuitum]|uniref:DUF4878 domain-containing protein n=1 Tax=Mycolicibacterium fortuitum TaxID=1766 RepID=UPI000A928FA7|nr:DUF4878 domain-containing protein [Mycolicibacterium fortuitum]
MADWSGGQFGNSGQPSAPGWPTTNPNFSSAPPPSFSDYPLATPPPVFGAPHGAPPPKRRKGMVIGLVAAAVVTVLAVLAALTVVITRSDSSDGTGAGGESPQAAVVGYLEALARGDAATALSYGKSQPVSAELLTDEILRQQIAKWPITDIRVLDTTDNSVISQVHVTAKFGNEVSEAKLLVEKQGSWKISNAFIKIDKTQIGQKDAETVTVFGKPIDQPRYVFPGWVDIGSSSPYLNVTSKPMLLQQLAAGASVMSMTFNLSDAGEQAVRAAGYRHRHGVRHHGAAVVLHGDRRGECADHRGRHRAGQGNDLERFGAHDRAPFGCAVNVIRRRDMDRAARRPDQVGIGAQRE